MSVRHSRVTSQGQISVPADVRKRLGVGPGSMLEWEERNGEFLVRRAGRNSSEDIHAALFQGRSPGKARSTSVKAGIRKYIRRRHARD